MVYCDYYVNTKRKAIEHMKKINKVKMLRSSVICLVVAAMVFGFLPEAIFAVMPPIFQVGIPAILSIYFDLFSGFVQAYVFCLLTMVYISGSLPDPR